MKTLLGKFLRWALLTVIVAVLTLLIALYVAVGSEAGTRYILRKAAPHLPVSFDADAVRGTLLSELRVPAVRYSGERVQVTVRDGIVDVDWSRTSTTMLRFDRIRAAAVQIDRQPSETPGDGNIDINMPPLPIALRARAVDVSQLAINDVTINDIMLQRVLARHQTFSASTVSATIRSLFVEAKDASIQLSGPVPVSGRSNWRMSDGSLQGQADIGGTLQRYSADFDATYRLAPDALIRARGSTTGTLQGLERADFRADTPLGQAEVTASLAWLPELALSLEAAAEDIDVAYLTEAASSALDIELTLEASSVREFRINVLSLAGTLNEQRVQGVGHLTRRGDEWLCGQCNVNLGQNRVTFDGSMRGQAVDADIDIAAPALRELWPPLAGSLQAKGRVSGSMTLPILSGSASASDLAYEEWKVSTLMVRSRASTLDTVDVEVDVAGLKKGESDYGSGHAEMAGNIDALDIDVNWALEEYAAEASGRLAIDDEVVRGTIASASVSEPRGGQWSATSPFTLQFSPGNFELGPTAWTNDTLRITQNRIALSQGQAAIDVSVDNAPLQLLDPFLPSFADISGTVDVVADVVRNDSGWSGLVTWQQQDTRLLLTQVADESLDIPVPTAMAEVRLDNNRATVSASLQAEPAISATLDATLDTLSADAPMEARVQGTAERWDWIPALVPEIDNVSGTMTADISSAGTLAAPEFDGSIRWRDGELAVPVLNLPITDIDLQLAGTQRGDLSVSGSAKSGDGSLQVAGQLRDIMTRSREFEVELIAERANLLNLDDYKLNASHTLTIRGNMSRAHLTGTVDMHRADIIVRGIPEGAVKPSDDVRVEGREEEQDEALRLTGDVLVKLGKNVHVQAFGLDTRLRGNLRVIRAEQREPRAEGELDLVEGFFEIYGQRLEIERGTMIFNGPLDDPTISVRAVREIDELSADKITVGIELSGRAQNLTSNVYSNPSMSEAEALSYLMFGRPLAGTSAEDGSALSSTAYALGLRQAGLITNQIGQVVGLDELEVTGRNQNTTELVAGKQINTRLYARYAYGVFSKLGRLLLRYRLSEALAIEVGVGESQSMDILYTIETD